MDGEEELVEIETGEEPEVKVEEPIVSHETNVDEPTIEEALAKLQRDKAVSDQQAARSQREAQEYQSIAQRSAANEHQANIHLVNSAIETVNRDVEITKNNLAQAHANQDYTAVADLQFQLSQQASRLQQLDMGKQALERETPAPVQHVAPPSDPVEAYASQLPPNSAKWVREHPEYARDPRLNRKLLAAHELAMADGHVGDTPEYIAAVEDTLRIVPQRRDEPQQESALSQASQAKSQRTPPPAAPVSRGSNGMGSKPGRATLTRAEAEAAAMSGMTHQEYWKEKQKLKAEGKMQ